MKITIQFVWRYKWIGVHGPLRNRYTSLLSDHETFRICVCIIPCFPIIIAWRKDYR